MDAPFAVAGGEDHGAVGGAGEQDVKIMSAEDGGVPTVGRGFLERSNVQSRRASTERTEKDATGDEGHQRGRLRTSSEDAAGARCYEDAMR